MELKKNDTVEIEITGTTSEGNGVGRYGGMAIFVPDTAQGDVISALIVKVAKNYAFGKVKSILSPSPHRIQSDCPASVQCGGCVFRHISYPAELDIKKQRIEDAIRRIGGFADLPVNDILGSECPDFYRNKAQLPVRASKDGGIETGFFAPRSHRIVGCDQCRLQPREFADTAAVFVDWMKQYGISPYNENAHTGTVRHLYIRKGFVTGEIMVCAVINAQSIKGEAELVQRLTKVFPAIKSIILNINTQRTNVILGERCRTLYGADYITDYLCGLKFKISPLSFYQVNHDQAERLYALAAEYAALTGEETVLDLYCGTGTIGLSMADKIKQLIGVEIVEQAVENAKNNAAVNGITNARFICADAAKAADMLRSEGVKPDVVILDPPRKGCSSQLLDTIVDISPVRIVYVSCDCATLARDMAILAQKGYRPTKVTPVDMFPRTSHVETVVLMSKIKEVSRCKRL